MVLVLFEGEKVLYERAALVEDLVELVVLCERRSLLLHEQILDIGKWIPTSGSFRNILVRCYCKLMLLRLLLDILNLWSYLHCRLILKRR